MSNGKWKMEKSNLVAIYHVRTSVCIETSGVDMFDLEIKKIKQLKQLKQLKI